MLSNLEKYYGKFIFINKLMHIIANNLDKKLVHVTQHCQDL
jgi:hypothetical protein